MKNKVLYSTIATLTALTSSAFAEYYTAGGTITADFTKSPAVNDFANVLANYEGISTNALTFEWSGKEWNEHTVGTIKNDYTIDADLTLKALSANCNNPVILISANKTLTVNGTITPDTSLQNVRVYFKSEVTELSNSRAKVEINKALDYSKGGEMCLNAVDITFQADTQVGSYTHFYNAPQFKVKNANVTMAKLYMRASSVKKDDKAYSGSISVDNATITINNIDFNGTATKNASFDFNFVDASKAETIKVNDNTLATMVNDTWNYNVYFDGFGIGDKIITKTDLDAYSKFFMDGETIASLVANGTLIDDTTMNKDFHTYYLAIPEPSTYAMIFGAIALGFVAYRRRK